jgi:hypothetical protein
MPTTSKNVFTHSGTTGDTFLSLSVVKLLGGGDMYLRLHNMNNMIQQKLGWPDAGIHSGRMSQKDFDVIAELIRHQPYINKFEIYNGETWTHELEEVCRHHQVGRIPRNFSNQYARSQGIDLDANLKELQMYAWMECREPRKIPNKPIAIARNDHYQEGNEIDSPSWRNLINRGLLEQCFFIGLDSDHAWFEDAFKVKVHHHKTPDFMEMARVISAAEMFVGNQSSPAGLAIALGKTCMIETRKNEKLDNNEIFYPFRTNIQYF